MTTVGQHPGREAPQLLRGANTPMLRIMLVLLTLAVVGGLGYLAYEQAADEPVAQPEATLASYPSYDLVQGHIDIAKIAEPSSVEIVQTEIDAALIGMPSAESSVEIVQGAIDDALRRRLFANAWGNEFLKERFGALLS